MPRTPSPRRGPPRSRTPTRVRRASPRTVAFQRLLAKTERQTRRERNRLRKLRKERDAPGLLDARWGYLNRCIRDKKRVIQWLVQSHQSLRRRLNNGEPYPFPDDSSEDTSTTSASTGHSSVLSSPSSTGSSAALQP